VTGRSHGRLAETPAIVPAPGAGVSSEYPFYFDHGGIRLFGVLHQPPTATGKPSFVFCHPFAEEKLWAHRVLVSFARTLVSEGHAVLRFDCAGSGDSDGRPEDTSLETMCADVRCAVDAVRGATRCDAVSLLGLRFGATIASLVAETLPEIRHLVLWAPILDGQRYMQEFLRANLTTQLAAYREIRWDRAALAVRLEQGHTVNVDGYEMAWPLFQQASAVRLGTAAMAYGGPCLVAQTSGAYPDKSLEAFAAAYRAGTLVDAPEQPFWREIPRFYGSAPMLAAATLGWLREL
jgi:uncharacterized protein